jgi:MATE family multidrug resistance protein
MKMSKNTISHREILNMAGPMIIANISVPLLGMIDTAVVGHLDSAHYLGGVAIGAMIFTFLFWSFGFLRMVTTGLTAQAHGKGDKQDLLQTLVKSIILACVIAILILLLQFLIK